MHHSGLAHLRQGRPEQPPRLGYITLIMVCQDDSPKTLAACIPVVGSSSRRLNGQGPLGETLAYIEGLVSFEPGA